MRCEVVKNWLRVSPDMKAKVERANEINVGVEALRCQAGSVKGAIVGNGSQQAWVFNKDKQIPILAFLKR